MIRNYGEESTKFESIVNIFVSKTLQNKSVYCFLHQENLIAKIIMKINDELFIMYIKYINFISIII